ncbi:chloride channel protein [Thermostilla marina]
MSLWSFLTRWFPLREIFDLESSGRVLAYSVLVGVVAGLGAAAFYWLLEIVKYYAQEVAMGYVPPLAGGEGGGQVVAMHLPRHWWAVVLIPTIGGLLCGLLVYTFAPEAEGHGTDAMIKAYHFQRGLIRGRVPIIKSIASIITIGTGGSAGREGPIAQIGAGFGSFLATKLGLSDWERRMLLIAGAAGGIGAIFRAPLGGALFVVEVLYASTAIEFTAFGPAMVGAVVAYTVFASLFGQGAVFHVPTAPDPVTGALPCAFHGAHELPFYLVFALICAIVGFVYVNVFYGLRDRFFAKLPVPNHVKPAIGALLMGILAIAFPHVMSGGYGWIQDALLGRESVTLRLMIILVGAKILATSLTISSGGSGGVFAPSLFVGAMLGAAVGTVCNHLFPGAPPVGAFILVGMGGFFAGVAKVPLTALIMVSEMSGSYELLAPLMLVSFVHVAALSSRWTLYEEQVHSLIDSPAHLGDFVVDVLENIKIRDVWDPGRRPIVIAEDMPLPQVLRLVADSRDTVFPVVNSAGQLIGLLSLQDLRSVLAGEGAGSLIVAADISRPPITVAPDENLHTVLRVMAQRQLDEIPVLNDAGDDIACMLRRHEILNAYDAHIHALKHNNGEH